MEHAYIEENSLIERYHQGRLPPEEEARFEAHFAACPQCLEQLEMARDLQLGLRAMAAEEAARTAQIGLIAWFARQHRALQAGMVVAAILVATGLPVGGYFFASSGLRATIAEAHASAADWQQRYLSEHQSASELRQQLSENERQRGEEQGLAETGPVAREPAAQGDTERPRQPQINTPVFLLALVRGEPGEPAATIHLGQIGDSFALAVDAGGDPRFADYRVTITDAGGALRWRRDGLLVNALEALMITFPASFFDPGDYRLDLAGRRPDGDTVELGGYSFRVAGGR
jgi:hypothetical protein